MGHARALVAITDAAWQLTLARRIASDGLSVRDAERLAKAGPGTAPAPGAGVAKEPHIKELETNLYHLFGTRVTVKEKGGKGAMTLHFDSKEHFQRVVALMDRIIKQANHG
jgi:ParB family chromosome partitioning protein